MSGHRNTFWGGIIDTRRSAFGNLSALGRAVVAARRACKRRGKPVTDEDGFYTRFYNDVLNMYQAAIEREGRARARTRFPARRGTTTHTQPRRASSRATRTAAKAGDDGGGSDDGADGDSEPPRPVIPSAPVWAHRIPLGPHNRIGFFPSRRFVPRSWRLERGRSA